jgi:hypothetical protein
MLTIIPEPTDALVTSWTVNSMWELAFNQRSNLPGGRVGQSTAAIQGDIIVLDPHGCDNVHTRNLAQSFPLTAGVKAVLQDGGVAREYAIAQGKFNELPEGMYRICFATKTSEGESKDDFRLLTKTIELKPKPATGPTLEVPDVVALGSDIVITWNADNDLESAVVSAGTWVGLYKSNSCVEYDVKRHKCSLATRALPFNTTSGTVRFSRSEYLNSGEFDVRYFRGDSRHGQGVVCRGLKEISETYLQCMLEPAATSKVIFVDSEEISSSPEGPGMESRGLEGTWNNGEETFEAPKT